MVLEKIGFKTGFVTFPGLELTIELPPNRFFRNDGLVSDIEKKRARIYAEFGLKYEVDNSANSYGHQHPITMENGEKGSLIYVLNTDPITNVFNFGHESVHSMINLGLEGQFLDCIRSEGYSLNPFESFSDEEEIAHVGGMIALRKEGLLWCLDHPELNYIKERLRASRIRATVTE